MKGTVKRGVSILQCVALVTGIFMLTGCGVPKDQHDALQKKYAQAQKKNQELNNRNRDLQRQVDRLTAEKKTLEVKYQHILKENQARKEAEAKKAEKTREAEKAKRETEREKKAEEAREAAMAEE